MGFPGGGGTMGVVQGGGGSKGWWSLGVGFLGSFNRPVAKTLATFTPDFYPTAPR